MITIYLHTPLQTFMSHAARPKEGWKRTAHKFSGTALHNVILLSLIVYSPFGQFSCDYLFFPSRASLFCLFIFSSRPLDPHISTTFCTAPSSLICFFPEMVQWSKWYCLQMPSVNSIYRTLIFLQLCWGSSTKWFTVQECFASTLT